MTRRRKKSSSRSSALTKPQPNDVLLGRGSGANQFQGNKQFRSLAEARKEEYVASGKYRDKARIAEELLDKIHSLGGRFLQLSEDDDAERVNIVAAGKWVVATEDVALEKCKQALREKKQEPKVKPTKKTKKKVAKKVSEKKKEEPQQQPEAVTPPAEEEAGESIGATQSPFSSPPLRGMTPISPTLFSSVLPSTLPAPGSIDGYLQLFQRAPCLQYSNPVPCNLPNNTILAPETSCTQNSSGLQPTNPIAANGSAAGFPHQFATIANGWTSQQDDYAIQPLPVDCGAASSTEVLETDVDQLAQALDCKDVNPLPKDATTQQDEGEYLLSLLSLSNRQTLSEEQERHELATMTDEEQASVLADMFGEMCNVDSRPEKRLRRDLDRESISFLVGQMRLELQRIPTNEKEALSEAQLKAHPNEFSDERLLTFLRCESMNVKLAAKHFCTYWQCRREVFGDKYLLRMRLSEALRDDLVAVEAGVIVQLPFPDLSGRRMIFVEPCRHTRQGYTSESMLRAMWYVIETVAQDSTAVDGSIVQVLWDANSTMFDYDRKVNDRVNFFRDHAWPVRIAGLHTCCSPKFVIRILKPIMMALKTKTTRSRTVFHDVPQHEILPILSNYGILPAMLPTEMGGSVVLNQREWMAQRWAIEMEEI